MQWAVLTTKVDLGIGVIAAAAVDMRASLCYVACSRRWHAGLQR